MRVDILGAPVDALSLDETISRIDHAITNHSMVHQVSLNVAKLVNMRSDDVLREDVVDSTIINADGMGIYIAARMLGHKLPERIAGVDLMIEVLQLCARKGYRPYFLGATQDVVSKAAMIAENQFHGLRMAGFHNGYFSESQENIIVKSIIDSHADCLFIAMPTPRKERFMKHYRNMMGVPFIMGVGGSLDILSGKTKRAPRLIQNIGMEWAYRLAQEPRRMFWRYARTNCIFAYLLARELLKPGNLRISK